MRRQKKKNGPLNLVNISCKASSGGWQQLSQVILSWVIWAAAHLSFCCSTSTVCLHVLVPGAQRPIDGAAPLPGQLALTKGRVSGETCCSSSWDIMVKNENKGVSEEDGAFPPTGRLNSPSIFEVTDDLKWSRISFKAHWPFNLQLDILVSKPTSLLKGRHWPLHHIPKTSGKWSDLQPQNLLLIYSRQTTKLHSAPQGAGGNAKHLESGKEQQEKKRTLDVSFSGVFLAPETGV